MLTEEFVKETQAYEVSNKTWKLTFEVRRKIELEERRRVRRVRREKKSQKREEQSEERRRVSRKKKSQK